LTAPFGWCIVTIRGSLIIRLLFGLLSLAFIVICSGCAESTVSQDERTMVLVSPVSLKEHVVTLSQAHYPRSYAHHDNLKRCAGYIRDHFEKAGAPVTTQFYTAGGMTYENVIGCFGPDEGERVIVGAHYDAAEDTPGADDNASAVAGLIELAYLLGKEKPKGHVELVAYSTEEPPFFGTDDMGSAHHAKGLHEMGVKMRLMIALECIGYFTDEPGSQAYPVPFLGLFYPDKGDYIGIVGRFFDRALVKTTERIMRAATDLPVESIHAPRFLPGIHLSDHRNYWQYGYRAIMITDTAFYRNAEYHRTGDTADRLDYVRMAKVVVGVYAVIRGFADSKMETRGLKCYFCCTSA